MFVVSPSSIVYSGGLATSARGRQHPARMPLVAREGNIYGTPSNLNRTRNLHYKGWFPLGVDRSRSMKNCLFGVAINKGFFTLCLRSTPNGNQPQLCAAHSQAQTFYTARNQQS